MSGQLFHSWSALQLEQVESLLDSMSLSVVQKGARLCEQGLSGDIWWEVEGKVLTANMEGEKGEPVLLSLFLSDGRIQMAQCSCNGRSFCCHVAAVLLVTLELSRCAAEEEAEAKTFKVLEASQVKNGAVKTVDGSPGQAGEKVGKGEAGGDTALVEKASEVVTVAAEPALADIFREIGKGQISRRDQKLLWGLEELFRSGRAAVSEADLLKLGGYTEYFYASGHYRKLVLWPEHRPPRSLLEAWLYVAAALRAVGKLPEAGAFAQVPWDQVDRLLAPWFREREVDTWKKAFGALVATDSEAVVPTSVVFRLRLSAAGGQVEWRRPRASAFETVKVTAFRQHVYGVLRGNNRYEYPLDDKAAGFLRLVCSDYEARPFMDAGSEELAEALNRLLRLPGFEDSVVSPGGLPLLREKDPLCWHLEEPQAGTGRSALEEDYGLTLRTSEGAEVPAPLAVLKGSPALFVTLDRIYEYFGVLSLPMETPTQAKIPAAALETEQGVAVLDRLGLPLPERLAPRVVTREVQVQVECRLHHPPGDSAEYFQVRATASTRGNGSKEQWDGFHWSPMRASASLQREAAAVEGELVRVDRSLQNEARAWLAEAEVKSDGGRYQKAIWLERRLSVAALREFPAFFIDWLARRPAGLEVALDPELAALRDGQIAGRVRLDAEEAGVDWFDLRVSLDLSEVELSQSEIDALLKAQGRWIRLPDKGWRRLDFQLSEDEHSQLADLGLGVGDLASGETQRFHVLQLAGAAATRLLPAERVEQVRRRAEELRTEVTPEVPAAITAELRPYQRQGYHFLAYLSANRFGGILADDMGLGKTVQTLSWLAWLRETGQLDGPALVICPKSVQDNWRAEVARFCPGLRVRVWSRQTAGVLEVPEPQPAGAKRRRKKPDQSSSEELVIINYTQLRLHEELLQQQKWSAVVLDEAQFIKNPSSHTTRAACRLQSTYRLALSGTPIENRLLDLWSIMNFAMPGVLGNRSAFSRNFNGKEDPLARRRLSARVRPFVLRRTKKEVAQDLPDRIEEEIVCELEGPQATLYRAELKRARAMLLKAKTSSQLDKLRFNILTSLLRLRQICCHPTLVGAGKPGDDSAKLSALLELLEPLIEEGHKVLVFSQFVEMLELIRGEVSAREWPHLLLTGQTEDRGAMVDTFQATEGASIFLISLKAGGFGLNLTAASYVVLFDPWWNPAVENQAIDRTHRIGQVNKVIAYRLLVRETIEEKIRQLQKQKQALAGDVLGEEGFAKALTLDDFRFLLGGGEQEAGG